MNDPDDKPTVLTIEDIDNYVRILKDSEIKKYKCMKCPEYYLISYGHHIQECDNCYFSRFPKEDVESFCRSYLCRSVLDFYTFQNKKNTI